MERNALLAAAISIAILLLYYEFLLPVLYPKSAQPRPPSASQQATPKSAEPDALTGDIPQPETVEADRPVIDAPEITVETDLYSAVFTAAGGRLKSLELKRYPANTSPGSPPLQMVSAGAGHVLPLGLELRGKETLKDAGIVYEIRGEPLRLSGEQEGTISLVWRAPGVLVEKRLRFHGDQYPFVLEVVPQEVPTGTQEVGISWVKGTAASEEHGASGVFQGVIALVSNKLVHRSFTDLGENPKGETLPGGVSWAGYGSTYFVTALIPETIENTRLWLHYEQHTAEARVLARVNGAEPVSFEVYAGPKEMSALEGAGHGLQKVVDYGYFAFIAIPLLQVLRFLHYLTGNWGLAIILLTVAIKILFIPLTRKSLQSMREMQKLQPQMAKLRERLKDNPEQMNKEIMELYRRHKVNPLSGCLPMLLQIPVFIGLYNALLNAIELRHAPFFLWINDLSSPDRLGALPLPFVEPPGIPVLTLIMGVTMLVQQWMTPAAGDPMQQRMMMFMPIIFTVMFVNFPSGLVLYWLVNNVLTIAQQWMTMRSGEK